MAGETLLCVEALSKRFGGTQALRVVDFDLRAGEIHALLGENGAGKSTLIKVLAGIHRPDDGTVRGPHGPAVLGAPVPDIAFVHQDLGLVDTLSVVENVALGTGFARRGPLIDWRATRRAAVSALAAAGLDADPDAPVGRLGSAERSMIAIARALVVEARILVLDEPTATLPEADVRRLHDALRRLRDNGMGIIYITHRLDEVFRLADRLTVLRDGAVCNAGAVADATPDGLVEAIVGRRMDAMFPDRAAPAETELMRVEGLASRHAGPVDFTLRTGEVLGLVGLRNAGQDIVGRMLAGALPARAGRVEVEGRALPLGSVGWAIARGLGFVSSKRTEESVCQGLSLRENLFLDPRLAGLGRINGAAERARARDTLDVFGVRPADPERSIATLSGGNQQKVVLARWLGVGRRVMVLEEPTIGVDVGARAEIYRLLAEAAAEGLGTVVVSSDFEEVAGLCDRAIVFDRGRPITTLAGAALTVAALTRFAGGEAGPEGQAA